jgi:plastocyanin
MNRTAGIVIAVLVLLVGGWFLLAGTPAGKSTDVTNQNPPVPIITEAPTPVAGPTVVYSDTGYSPSTITVPKGAIVTFVNQSSKKMWVASAQHPSHSVYSGTTRTEHCPDATNTTFDQCVGGDQGTSWSFTFDKAGTWKYHDHLDASKFGTVVVTE